MGMVWLQSAFLVVKWSQFRPVALPGHPLPVLTCRSRLASCALGLTGCPSAPQNVMDDFVCALKKRILLQGRMYVFEHYVCFHSNVLGYVKNKIIPLKVAAPAVTPMTPALCPCHALLGW